MRFNNRVVVESLEVVDEVAAVIPGTKKSGGNTIASVCRRMTQLLCLRARVKATEYRYYTCLRSHRFV